MEPSFHSESLKRFSAHSRWPGWADPLLRQHPSSFATMMSFFHLSPPRPRHAGSRGPGAGTCAQPSPATPITPTAHPRPAPARGWGRPRSRADRLALTLTRRSCGRRPILGLAQSPSRTPGSLGHPRGAGRRWRAGAAARAGRPGPGVALPGSEVPGSALPGPAARPGPAGSRSPRPGQVWPPLPDSAGPTAASRPRRLPLGPRSSPPRLPAPSPSVPSPLALASPLPFGPSSAPRPSARSPSPPPTPPFPGWLPAPSPC